MGTLADPVTGSNGIAEAPPAPPIIVDLGKARRKRVRALKKGRGRLMEEVNSVIEEVKGRVGDPGGKEFIPIIVIYRQKSRRSKGGLLPFLR